MRGWIGIGEAADLPLLIIQQPADTPLWWVPFNLWSVLIWHAPELFHMSGAWLVSKRPLGWNIK